MRADVDARAWGSLYRLAINTRLVSSPGMISLGIPIVAAPA